MTEERFGAAMLGRLLMALACASLAGASFAATALAPATPATAHHRVPLASSAAAPASPAMPVDINSAGRAQLKTLPGIGDAEAARIIDGRPYLSKADLASKGVIPLGVYLSLKGRVIAVQKALPKKVAATP
jgi:competence protein ComEA